MDNVNLSEAELDALNLIDVESLRKCINQCKIDGYYYPLRDFRLFDCGGYISTCEHRFNLAIDAYSTAKSSKKRNETKYDLDRAGSNLIHSVEFAKNCAKKQMIEQKLYVIDDLVSQPLRKLTRNLRVRVSFMWRDSEKDHWKNGSITVTHTVPLDPFNNQQVKWSRDKIEHEKQDSFFRDWEYLASLTKFALRDHFREGKSGSLIPVNLEAIPDDYTGGLNNFSVKF